MSLYLDTSVVVPLFVEEPSSKLAMGWLAARTEPILLADLAFAEYHSAISRLVRMRRVDLSSAGELRAQFREWVQATTQLVEINRIDIRIAADLVQSPFPRLLPADAIHVAACLRLGATLVTFDNDLQAVATREGVRWASPRSDALS